MITDKVRPHHLERKALLYVRQSSAHQALHNRESSALQYVMRDRLTALGANQGVAEQPQCAHHLAASRERPRHTFSASCPLPRSVLWMAGRR